MALCSSIPHIDCCNRGLLVNGADSLVPPLFRTADLTTTSSQMFRRSIGMEKPARRTIDQRATFFTWVFVSPSLGFRLVFQPKCSFSLWGCEVMNMLELISVRLLLSHKKCFCPSRLVPNDSALGLYCSNHAPPKTQPHLSEVQNDWDGQEAGGTLRLRSRIGDRQAMNGRQVAVL
jgi:hypothetical protein